MSNFMDGARSSAGTMEQDQAWASTLGSLYPNLASALLGCISSKNGADPMPPMSLGISKKNGGLRFTLYSPDFPRTYFGPQIDANDLLAGIEQALAENLGEWGPPKKNGDGRRH